MNYLDVSFGGQTWQVPDGSGKGAREEETIADQVAEGIQWCSNYLSYAEKVGDRSVKYNYESNCKVEKTLVDDEVVGWTGPERPVTGDHDAREQIADDARQADYNAHDVEWRPEDWIANVSVLLPFEVFWFWSGAVDWKSMTLEVMMLVEFSVEFIIKAIVVSIILIAARIIADGTCGEMSSPETFICKQQNKSITDLNAAVYAEH